MEFDKFAHQTIIENVSRRNLLKGIVSAGGLVIAAVPTALGACGGIWIQDRRGWHARWYCL